MKSRYKCSDKIIHVALTHARVQQGGNNARYCSENGAKTNNASTKYANVLGSEVWILLANKNIAPCVSVELL